MKRLLNLSILFAVLLMFGCSGPTPVTPEPLVTPISSTPSSVVHHNGSVTASGEIVPEREAKLSFSQNGWVEEVAVEVGDQIQAGDLVAQLEGLERLEASLAGAQTELLAAQQAMDALYENHEITRAKAYQEVVEANEAVGQVKTNLYYFDIPAHLAELSSTEALEQSIAKLEAARQVYKPYLERNKREFRRAGTKDSAEKQAEDQLEWAQSDFNNSLRRMKIEAELMNAEAKLEQAKLVYDDLKTGPDPDQLAIAQARLEQAQADLEQTEAALDQIVLFAPFGGTVVTVETSVGETLLPGQVVAVIGDLSSLKVETSDLSERDVSEVAVGQKVIVHIEALNKEVTGRLSSIAPQSNTMGGDVVYTATIILDEHPAGLRWGMSVEVEIMTQ